MKESVEEETWISSMRNLKNDVMEFFLVELLFCLVPVSCIMGVICTSVLKMTNDKISVSSPVSLLNQHQSQWVFGCAGLFFLAFCCWWWWCTSHILGFT